MRAHCGRETVPGLAVFDTRLSLTVLDALGTTEHPAARPVVDELIRRTTQARDGYAAREVLSHPGCTALMTFRQTQDLNRLVRSCALASGAFPPGLWAELSAALRTSNGVIKRSHHGCGLSS